MVYSTQNYWGFGLFPLSGVLESRNTTFRKLDPFPSLGERGGKRHLLSWASLKELISITGPATQCCVRMVEEPTDKLTSAKTLRFSVHRFLYHDTPLNFSDLASLKFGSFLQFFNLQSEKCSMRLSPLKT
jgi:hypothetical protein